jgi:hypothetical protein
VNCEFHVHAILGPPSCDVFIQDGGWRFPAYSGSCLRLYCVCFAAGYVETVVYLHSLSSHWTMKSIYVGFADKDNRAIMDYFLQQSGTITNQPANLPGNLQPTNQLTDRLTDQPTNQPTNQPASQLANQPTSQP